MALTDAQAKIIAQNKKKQEEDKKKASTYSSTTVSSKNKLSTGSQLSPLDLMKKDAATKTTVRDKVNYAKQSGASTNTSKSIQANKEKQAAKSQARSQLTLSESDLSLPSLSQKGILDAKIAWQEAYNAGDKEGMAKAHADAEKIRSRYGYSGGSSGSEKIEGPGLTEKDKVTLNQSGQQALLSALTLGDKERAEEVRKAKGFQATDFSQKKDGEGRTIFSQTKAEQEKAGDQFLAGLEAAGKGFAGSLLSLHETFNQAMRNYNRDRWGRNLEANANQTKDKALAEASRKALEGATIVDPNLPGQRLLRESQEASRKALEGKTGLEALLAKAGISGAQMLPGIAASLIPGVGPAVGATILGAQAAGSKMGELNEQSSNARMLSYMQGGDPRDYGEVTPQEAFTRGIISGGIEGLTERIPIKGMLKIVKGNGGANFLVSIAKQAGTEATEESASTVLNHLADLAAKDPNASITLGEVVDAAIVGAISGAGFGAAGTAINSAIGKNQQKTGQETLLKVAGIGSAESQQNEPEQMFEQPQQKTPVQAETPVQEQELGETTEEELRAEFEAMGAMSKGGAGAFASWQGQTPGENFHPINERAAAVTAEQRGRAQTEIPTYNLEGRLTSKTISTFANANILPNEMVTAVESNLADGAYSRIAYTDSQALQDAEAIIEEKGFQGAKEYWLTQTANGRINKANFTLGIALINRAANSPSLHVDAMDLLSRYADYAKDAGQALQAMNMINKLTPQGQLYTMVKAVEYLEERAAQNGNAVNVEINPELVTAFMEAETQQERNEIKQEMIKDAAAQLPATWRDRFDSWRYLAMLGNARTHIRNVFGNAGFAVVRGAKNVTAAGMESLFGVQDRTTSVLNRFNAEDRARLAIANGEFPQVKEFILSGGKYMDDYSQINRERDVWKMDNKLLDAAFKPVSFLSKKNSELLDKEDIWFSRPAYTAALARYLKANGVTAEQYAKMKQEARDNPQPATRMVQKEVYAPGTVVKAADRSNYGKVVKYNRDDGTYSVHFVSPSGSEATVTLPASVLSAKGERVRVIPAKELLESGDVGGFVEQAQAHAIKEAQKATYRDTNAFSEALSQISKMRHSDNKAVRQLGYLAEGVFPFKKTPANILVRGVEYSPIGLAKGLGDAVVSNRAESWANKGEGKNVLSKKIIKLEKDLASNAKTPAEAIDEISAGLTGTGLLGLGMALAYLGIATGGASDDDKQDDFNELQSHQNYALEIGNRSLTLDWLAPEALPFFVGVELTKFLQQRSEGEATADGLVSSLMRIADPMLEMSMLQGLNDLFTAFGSDYALSSAAWTAATSYLTQFLPTLTGQFERIGETTRETTFVDPDSGVPKGLQYLLGNIGNKIPGWEYNQVEYVDAWGRKEETGNLALRAFNNLINPAYYSEIQTGSTEAELQRLYDLGYDSVFPSSFQKSTEINGEKVSADQWLAMQTTRGQTAKSVLDSFIGTEQYNAMSDDEKAAFVKNILELSADAGKVAGGGTATSGAYKDAVAAGYSGERAVELALSRAEYADSNNGLYEFVISQESDYAAQEKLYNAFKDKGAAKSWGELAKEQAPVSARIKKAQTALDEAVPAEKQTAFETAISDAGANSQKATKLALLSVDATDAERVAYYNLVSARKGWKKSYYQVDMS